MDSPKLRATSCGNKIHKSPWSNFWRCARLNLHRGITLEQGHRPRYARKDLWILAATFMIALIHGVGANTSAAQANVQPPKATLHAITAGPAKGGATTSVNPAPA